MKDMIYIVKDTEVFVLFQEIKKNTIIVFYKILL